MCLSIHLSTNFVINYLPNSINVSLPSNFHSSWNMTLLGLMNDNQEGYFDTQLISLNDTVHTNVLSTEFEVHNLEPGNFSLL